MDLAMKDRSVANAVAAGNRNKQLTGSRSARLGGSDRIRSPDENAAIRVGLALSGYMRTRDAILSCEEWKRPAMEGAMVCACIDLLERVGDMKALQCPGMEPRLADVAERALKAIDANQARLKDGNPGMVSQARALLVLVDARDHVEHLLTTGDLSDRMRRPLLARALGEVSLLDERGGNGRLASAALEMVIGLRGSENPMERRAALAARLMKAVAGMPVPPKMADAARANLAALAGDVARSAGPGKELKRIRSQVVLNLANAYADMAVLDRARRETPGDGADKELLVRVLDMVIADPPSRAKGAAAELMKGRLGPEQH